jgi:16S rRNA (cytidine1402-2'-O)-methyltransferase
MGSGFNGQNFTFHGYLPIDRRARDKAIRKIEQQAVREGATQIFMETPYRNEQLLKAILDVCNESTYLCIARDLNGSREWVYTAPLSKWREIRPELHKIPAIFLISRS